MQSLNHHSFTAVYHNCISTYYSYHNLLPMATRTAPIATGSTLYYRLAQSRWSLPTSHDHSLIPYPMEPLHVVSVTLLSVC